MNDMPCSSQLVGEREEPWSLAVCVVEEQNLGHCARSTTVGAFASNDGLLDCASAAE